MALQACNKSPEVGPGILYIWLAAVCATDLLGFGMGPNGAYHILRYHLHGFADLRILPLPPTATECQFHGRVLQDQPAGASPLIFFPNC